MNSGRILVNGSSFYCGNSTSSPCQLALKSDIPNVTQYVHPSTKQCNYVYTHPSTQQCSNVNASLLSGHSYNDISNMILTSSPISVEKVYVNQPKNKGDSYFPSEFDFTNVFAVMIGASATITQTNLYDNRWTIAIMGAMGKENFPVSTTTPAMNSGSNVKTVSKLNSIFWRSPPITNVYGLGDVCFLSPGSNTPPLNLDVFKINFYDVENNAITSIISVSNLTVTVTAFRFNI